MGCFPLHFEHVNALYIYIVLHTDELLGKMSNQKSYTKWNVDSKVVRNLKRKKRNRDPKKEARVFMMCIHNIIYIYLLNLNHRNSYDKSRFIWYSSLDEEFLGCRKKGVQSRSRALDLLAGTFSHLGLVEWQLGLPYESHDILRVKTYIALLRVKRYIAYGSYDVLSFLRPRC
jgi:hypothetical protein